ncbi:MAG: three-Cys-motif partner protein TcmP [Flavobacteriaceae bacterium]|jgi:three-Cys-motif partner protein|nr:three-Cys-motif partner protein TcmP [Flavobacteriaceae bacterium]
MKKPIKKENAKKNILPHTQAKLDLFKGYLEHYLRVLCRADFCPRINIFDIFCGAGIYDDGKKGSPLLAVDCIENVNSEIGNHSTKITLTVNDFDGKKLENVRQNISVQSINNFNVDYYNEDANNMLDIVAQKVNAYPRNNRNLVFIDPYGYSTISKEKIINLLKNNSTEIILFLPVMQMYRFTEKALQDEETAQYEPLRNFINSFFNSQINSNSIGEYIFSIKEALSINHKYYTCSHYIEREKGNYYALFFMTSNIYGLEKMLETKWKLSPISGKGFNQQKQMGLFDETLSSESFEKVVKKFCLLGIGKFESQNYLC